MKKIVLPFFVLLLGMLANAQPPAGEAKPGEWYGEKVNPAGAVDISEIPGKLTSEAALDTKIKAKIVEVCPNKGCWLKLQVNDSTTAMVKMKDYGFFLPLAAKGKTVILEGEVKIKNTSVNELKHYAEDAKKSKEEIDAITKPKKEINITARGILVMK